MLIIAMCAALAFAGCGSDSSSTGSTAASTESIKTKPKVTIPDGEPPDELETVDLIEGDGKEAVSGRPVTVEYVGINYKTGKEFDSSWGAGGNPTTFGLGFGAVIPGWEQGVEGMKVGGRRELIIPPELAYGTTGRPPAIPPNETLVFVIDLVAVK